MNLKDDELLFLEGPATKVARRLLGCEIKRHLNGHLMHVKIVETEAYSQSDLASQSYRGETKRTKVMFGNYGHLYVYFTYGMHYCSNIVTGPKGQGDAVLIRAVEIISGQKYMALKRPNQIGINLTNGPAKLCQALSIDLKQNGHDLRKLPIKLIVKPEIDSSQIVKTTRIGISKAKDKLWRYYIKDNPYISKLARS